MARQRKQDYTEILDLFATQVDAVERRFDSIRHGGTKPLDLKLPNYDAYEIPESLVGRVVSNRFSREALQNLDRVAASIAMLKLTTQHIEALSALKNRNHPGIKRGDVHAGMMDAQTTFNGLLDGYTDLLKDGDTAEELQPIRRDINASLLDLTGRFSNVIQQGSAPYDLVTMDSDELLVHDAQLLGDYTVAMIRLRTYKLLHLNMQITEHIALYKHQDEGAIASPEGIQRDYDALYDRVTDVIDDCRKAHADATGVINDAFAMKTGHVFRPVTLDYTL